MRLSVNGSNVDIESIPFAGGRIVKTTNVFVKPDKQSEVYFGFAAARKGRMKFNGYEPQYYITDHLGSTRTIVKPKATVVAEFDYMPYGTQHAVATAPTTEADYKYTGKEQQTAFGLDNLYDSQARFQYVTDGMFLSHDPLSGNFSDISPYMYCGGDPINRVDQDGKKWVDKNGNLMWENGQWTKYATSGAMRIGIAMMATKTGASTFKRIANGASMMQLELNPGVKKKDKNTLTFGEMIPLSKNNFKFPDGHIELKESKIIIYEGFIKAFIDENKIDDDETYKLIMSLPDNVKIDGAIGSVGVHEGEHTSSENLSLHMDNTTNHANHDLEEKPIYMQRQYLKELIENLK